MNVDTHPWCEERDCPQQATHVVVWSEWAARLCEEHHRQARAEGAVHWHVFGQPVDLGPAPVEGAA